VDPKKVGCEDETKNERESKKKKRTNERTEKRRSLHISNLRKKSGSANAQAESRKSSVAKYTDKSIVRPVTKVGGSRKTFGRMSA
jgi:hypothetical protein